MIKSGVEESESVLDELSVLQSDPQGAGHFYHSRIKMINSIVIFSVSVTEPEDLPSVPHPSVWNKAVSLQLECVLYNSSFITC